MGYYSALDIRMQEEKAPVVPPKIEFLRCRLDYLWDRLEDLLRWSEDPQLHDRYFYSDHITQEYELPCTVQGALAAIEEITRQLDEHKEQARRYELWLETIRSTGATPEGQLVLSHTVFPRHHLQMDAA